MKRIELIRKVARGGKSGSINRCWMCHRNKSTEGFASCASCRILDAARKRKEYHHKKASEAQPTDKT